MPIYLLDTSLPLAIGLILLEGDFGPSPGMMLVFSGVIGGSSFARAGEARACLALCVFEQGPPSIELK